MKSKCKMRVLIIGPYAPHGQVGAMRIISVSRYLASQGHQIKVLCLSENTLKKIEPKGLTAVIPKEVEVETYDITIDERSIIKRNLINSYEFSRVLCKVLNQNTFDVILISGGPFYTFPAMREAEKRKIPFLVDYRDLHISSRDKRKRNGILNKTKFWLTFPLRYYQEYACVKRARFISVVAPEMVENLKSYFHQPQEKFRVVYNGFDDAQLVNIDYQCNRTEVLRIGYFGKLMYYNQEYTKMLFCAIERLVKAGKKIEFLHIGPENPMIAQYFETEKLNSLQWYTCTGVMNYSEGMTLLSSCNICTLEYAYPEGPGTKIFDYICLNKPVIGVTRPQIMLEKLIISFDHGYICHNEEEIVAAICDISNKKITTLIDSNARDKIRKYSRTFQNERFEKILIQMIEENNNA